MIKSSKSEPKSKKITIMLADDHPLMRKALRVELENQPDLEVVAEVANGKEAIEVATQKVPNVVIMDISMSPINGLEATKQIKAKCPSVLVLVLTVHDETEHIMGIIRAGADGYLTKTAFGEEVIQAVRGVVAGENILSPGVFQRIMKYALQHSSEPFPLAAGQRITAREQELLRLAARGMTNREIAQRIELSEYTVKSYFMEIFSKLNVGSRAEAVVTALRLGFLKLDDLS